MSGPAQERRLTLLGLILQALHVLFGITGIIGVLIAHTRLPTLSDPVYRSQLRWQIVTFWLSLLAYALAFWWWFSSGSPWPVFLVAAFVGYRLLVGFFSWFNYRPINRLI